MIKKITAILILAIGIMAFTTTDSTKYKCMIQMTNYDGEGAYIVISLINPQGEYEKTLYVHGEDEDWYHDIDEWWQFYGKRRMNIDAITGATISGGNRAVTVIDIPNDKIDKGYKLRFETAVEDQEYYTEDVQFELISKTVNTKKNGKGFIRYIRMMPQ